MTQEIRVTIVMVSTPLKPEYAATARSRRLRNFDEIVAMQQPFPSPATSSEATPRLGVLLPEERCR